MKTLSKSPAQNGEISDFVDSSVFSHIKEYMQAVTNIWGVAEGENHKKRATALQEELHTHPIKKGVTVRKSYATRQELPVGPSVRGTTQDQDSGYSLPVDSCCCGIFLPRNRRLWYLVDIWGAPSLPCTSESVVLSSCVCFSSTFSLFVPGIKTASSRKCKPIAKDWIPTVAADNFSLCMPLRPPEALSVR